MTAELHMHRWAHLPDGVRSRGRVVVIHGYGEHGGRYSATAAALNAAGWGVLAPDLPGHGLSPGRRGVLKGFDDLVDAVGVGVRRAAELLPGSGPTVVLGHSMGGLATVRYLQTRMNDGRGTVAGAILSAPWLGEVKGMTWWQAILSRVLRRVAPDLPIPSPLDPEVLTRDPDRARSRSNDPLVHDRASAGLVARAAGAREAALAEPVPPGLHLLVLVPGDDRLLDQEPTRRWARSLAGPRVTLRELAGRRHEPLNDLGRDEVLAGVVAWLAEVEEGD